MNVSKVTIVNFGKSFWLMALTLASAVDMVYIFGISDPNIKGAVVMLIWGMVASAAHSVFEVPFLGIKWRKR